MAVVYEKIVAEDLELGRGTVSVTNPAGGNIAGSKIGIHTFLDVVLTADLPAASSSMNKTMLIEDAGNGDWNLVIYTGGYRFRVQGKPTLAAF